MVGAGRDFGFDAAVTFGNWVATPAILDAFGRKVTYGGGQSAIATPNDHVLLSLISHLVFSLTGSRSEIVYRVLPAVAAGATVGLLIWVLIRRFGWLAGLSAGAFVAAEPVVVENSRDESALCPFFG